MAYVKQYGPLYKTGARMIVTRFIS